MHERLSFSSELPLTESLQEWAVPFELSPIASHPDTSIILNQKYFAQDEDPQHLLQHIWVPGYGTYAEQVTFFGVEPGTRGRELGNAANPVFIKDRRTGYYTLGILTLKAAGMRNLTTAPGEILEMQKPASAGVSGIDEVFKDAGYGDVLYDEGASIGNTVALISTSKEAFLTHYRSPNHGGLAGGEYARLVTEAWKNDHEYRPSINMQIRLTDPERIGFGFFTEERHMWTSAEWMQVELKANSQERFDARYGIPPGWSDHLLSVTRSPEVAADQARLLSYIIIRNYALAARLNINTSFKLKEHGSLGKLHDFSPAIVDETGSLERLNTDFREVFTTELQLEDALLDNETLQQVVGEVQSDTGYSFE